MLQIPCPYCGTRDELEFRFGGELHTVRPGLEASEAQWSAYLFNRGNTRGLQDERWLHAYGCGRWIGLTRDTVTHVIIEAFRLGARVSTGEAHQ